MLTSSEILKQFEESEAILKGHFILSSGLHSDTYIQCARALTHPERAGILCGELSKRIHQQIDINQIDYVISPAMGGLIVGYETARQLGKPFLFVERVDGKFELRRGFRFEEGAKILVIEDVVTTGKSSRETFKVIEELGGKVVIEAALINRSGQEFPLEEIPLVRLLDLNINSYTEDNLPPHLKDTQAIKPGSRWIRK